MSGRNRLAVLTGLVLIVAGCGQSVSSEHSDTSVEEPVTTMTSTELDEDVDLDVPLEEWDLAYSCADVNMADGGQPHRVSIPELEEVFSSHATQEQMDRIFGEDEYGPNPGPPTDWVAFGPDLVLARQPLDLEEITFLAAPHNPEYPIVEFGACRLTRSSPGGEAILSPSWHAGESTVAGGEQVEILVRGCGHENLSSVEIDAVVVGDQLVVSVRDQRYCDPAQSADPVALSVEVPMADGPLSIVDGAYWPWLTPVEPAAPVVEPLSQSAPTCTSLFNPPGLTVSWSGVPAAAQGQIMFDDVAADGMSFSGSSAGLETEVGNAMERRIMAFYGEDPNEFVAADTGSGVLGTFGDHFSEATRASITLTQLAESVTIECEQTAPPVYSCSMVLIAGIPAAVISDQYGEPGAPIGTFYRDGEAVTLKGFEALDPSASPGGTYHYTVRLGMNPAGVEEMDCGTVEVPASVSGIEELTQAQTIYRSIGIGPYEYVSFELICEGCPDTVWDGSGEHATFGGEADWEIVSRDGRLQASEIPLAVYPDTVHQVLIDAIASGVEVEYIIDRESGVPVQWTIDGVGMRYLCVNFDTRLPEMMPDGRCEEKYNALGN